MLRRFRDLPIRGKLLAMVLVPLALVLPLLGVILLAWANLAFDRLLITKVRSDLAVANGYFERVLGEVGASAAAVAESHALQLALARPASGELVTLLQRFKAREALDFIDLRRNDGTLLASDSGPDAALAAAPTLRPRAEAMRHATVEVLSLAELRALAPALLPRVTVPLVPTRNAAPTTRAQEDRAMVVLANAPVLAADGSLIGHVQAGVLLNRNLAFIDHINEIVYPAGSLPVGSRGLRETLRLLQRRLQVLKMRGKTFRPGYHDYTIVRGGLAVFPRLVSSEHKQPGVLERFPSQVAELDLMLGGGLERGTSTLVVGAPGTGKSTLSSLFAAAAAAKGENAAFFIFDESEHTLISRVEALGVPLLHCFMGSPLWISVESVPVSGFHVQTLLALLQSGCTGTVSWPAS